MASSAAFKRHLIHTCTIQRATVTADPYGDDERTWDDNEQDVACRLTAKQQRVFNDALAEWTTITVHLMLFAAGTDITDQDRITDVVLEDDSLVTADDGIAPQVFGIEKVLTRRRKTAHHVSVELKQIS